jgi:hypothetical protein
LHPAIRCILLKLNPKVAIVNVHGVGFKLVVDKG